MKKQKQSKTMSNMKVSSLKFVLIAVGLIICASMTTSCNKGYGCPSDFHVDATTEVPAVVPSC
jgi:hypothetical protein